MIPEKVIWFGAPDRAWSRIEETYRALPGGREVLIERKVFLRTSIELVYLRVTVAENVSVEPASAASEVA